MRTIINTIACGCLLLMSACEPSFQPIDYGKEACANCKMTIVDARYAAELLTGKGRVYKFDDLRCMKEYIADLHKTDEKAKMYVANFADANVEMIDANHAVYLQHDFFASPMNGNTAAFVSTDEAQHYVDSLNIEIKNWNALN